MGNGRTNGRDSRNGRHEPRFDSPARAGAGAPIVSADERGGPRRGGRERIEPPLRSNTPSVGDGRSVNGRGKGKDNGGGGGRRGRRRRRPLILRLISFCCVIGLWAGIGLVGLVAYYARELPPIDQLAIPKRPPNIAILGEDGTVLANRGDTGGAAMRLADLPPYLPKAFVAIEDRRFYSHYGIDPVGIARALLRNVSGGGGMQGGSTLTQQLAKNLFLTQERTVSRKIQEAILAVWLEHKFSKNQILELYLNRVYFGSGAYGVEAAAQRYFGKSAKVVTLPEAAVLAGLMKAPTKLAPMADEKFITPEAAKAALAGPAHAVKEREGGAVNYAADYVMDVLDDTVGAIDQDIVVTTTINPAMETLGEKALDDELTAKGVEYGVSQGALVSMDTSGAIKALIGGRNYGDSQFNRAVAAKRQPGSAFKPFVYLTALEHGLTPDTLRDDAPINVKGWQPENYEHEYLGPVTLTRALAQSLNTVAVRLGVEVGPKAVIRTAHRLGIGSDLQPNASIALGTSEVTPLELAAAYAPFANGGFGVQSHIITRVKTTDGKLLYQRKGSGFGRVVDPVYVGEMDTMLREVLLSGTAKKADLPGWEAAGKTGTSQDWRDAWFVGFTSALVTDVWVGNDDGTPTKKASGGSLPVEIWSRFMRGALKNTPITGLPAMPAPAPAPVAAPSDSPVARNAAPGGAPQATAGAVPARDLAPPTTLTQVITTMLTPAKTPAPPAPGTAPRAPMTINDAARAVPVPAIVRDPDALRPPAAIPDRQAAEGAGGDRNLLQRLFGG
jgi:penicillin-binding protein 1A